MGFQMFRFLALLTSVLIVFGLISQVLSRNHGYYTIVAPGTIRSKSIFHLSISLSDFHQSCWLNISLQDGRQEPLNLETIEIQPKTTKLVKLQAPYLIEKVGKLIVIGYRGIIKTEYANINFEHDFYSAFIQTNKAKYKPGEVVEFRVIFINQLTRPAQIDDVIIVMIYDGQENLIKQIVNVKLVQGVFKGEFQLSKLPVLGEWKIKVEVGGDLAAEKSFDVARYVPPKFLVKINTKSNVAINEEKISLDISANYFYGEPVKGKLNIHVNNTYAASHDKLPVIEKELAIDGKTTIDLDMKNDLYMQINNNDHHSKKLYEFIIKVAMIDDLSELKAWTSAEIAIHNQPFKIILQAPRVFDSSEQFRLMLSVSVTDLLDNPIRNRESPVKVVVQCTKKPGYWIDSFKSFEIEETLQNGEDDVTFHIQNKGFSSCNVYAEYLGIKSPPEWIQKNRDSLFIDILTESPEVGKELEIILKSKKPMDNFSYDVVSRGDIIQSETINVPDNQTTYILRWNVTYSMVPKITLFVHLIYPNGVFAGQLKDVNIKRVFQNTIEIRTAEETQPGVPVMINVTTDKGSYVGLMALDQRVLQNSNNKYDLTEYLVFTKLRNYDSLSIDSSPFPGLKAGLVTFSNAMTESGSGIGQEHSFLTSGIDGQEKTGVFDKPTIQLPRVRKLFSESWLYKDFERTSDTGLSFLETVPDTITSWAITGFSLNPKTGLTLTKYPTELKVFQKFFISFDLPNLVKQGEMIEVPIYLANYMNKDALTNVKIERSSEDLEILKNPETMLGSEEGISKLLPANGRDKIIIFIKPLKMGQFNITVKAFTSIASDAVQKTLNVKSEGIPKTISKTLLIHLPEEGIQNDEITFDIPENAIPASQKIEISVVGDIFRPLMRSLEKLARVPHGNGEDNMRVIVSNLLVLKYFQALNYTNPSLESKIRLHLELGYQNQLCFKHLDGSFGLFDRSVERSGDFWQTAFTLWGLHQVSSVIEIDSKVRERGLNYLKSKQLGNGCFKSNSGVFEDDVKFTAFGLIVFLMDNQSKTIYSEVVSKGLQYLSENSDNMEPSSVSILSTYVLLLGRHEKAKECLQKLSRHSRLTSKRMLKTKPDTLESQIETTAESLIHLFESQENKRQTLLHIVRGLITFEEEVSPLTSLIALRAMILFVDDLHLNRKNLDIGFNDDVSSSGIFQVNFENSQVLQTQKLSENSRRIHFQSKGYGFAVVDVKYEYNLVPAENKFPSTYATNVTTQSSSGALSVLEICVNVLGYISPDDLTIMEVNLQSGYIFDETNSEDIKNLAKAIELNDDREKVTIYFDKIDYNGICLKLGALEVYKVLDAKPGWVILYSTDRKDEQTTKTFYINK